MKKAIPFVKAACLVICLALVMGRATLIHLQGAQKRSTTAGMDAARQFLAALTPEQRAKAAFALDDQHRVTWFFVPMARKGLTLKEMTPAQRQKAEALLQTVVAARGLEQIHHIQNDLEPILKAMEAANNPQNRDPELYYFSVFGTPGERDPWGWRLEGHHVSLNITVANGVMTAWTPDFRGSNPAEVMQGPHQGLRVLASEEDTGFALLHSLDASQKQAAVLQMEAPREILTSNKPRVDPLSPEGLPASRMTAAQKKMLRDVIGAYGSRMVDEVATERMRRIDAAGFDKVTFAWIGADALHQGHYYRVQGPTFLIEFDNTQNNANHVHSVWRDFNGDFGEDVLKAHLAAVAH